MKLLHSLRAQLAAAAALLVLAIVAFSGITFTIQMDHRDRDALDRELQNQAQLAGENIDQLLVDANGDSATVANSFDALLNANASVVRYISGSSVLAERGDGPTIDAPIPSGTGFSTITIDGVAFRSLVVTPNPESSDQLQILQNISPLEDRLDSNRGLVAIITIVATLLAGIAGWIVTSVIVEPLQRLRRGVLAICTDGNVTEQLPIMRNPQEARDLAVAINSLLQKLQTSTKSVRRFTADAGHELRAPLTILGTELETLRRNPDLDRRQLHGIAQSMTIEHRRMVALLDGLQKLARGDAGAVPAREYIDIAELLGFCVRDAQQRFPKIVFRSHPYEGAMAVVEGWADGLRLAIGNLLENAAFHGHPNGHVDVELYADSRWIDITISDALPVNPVRKSVSSETSACPRTFPAPSTIWSGLSPPVSSASNAAASSVEMLAVALYSVLGSSVVFSELVVVGVAPRADNATAINRKRRIFFIICAFMKIRRPQRARSYFFLPFPTFRDFTDSNAECGGN
ncbi:MAG: histidine kinase dimerization/phospho-acceptor domain-containing protein [Chthoniobacterales bacterium]